MHGNMYVKVDIYQISHLPLNKQEESPPPNPRWTWQL